jgi:hypothetical protein
VSAEKARLVVATKINTINKLTRFFITINSSHSSVFVVKTNDLIVIRLQIILQWLADVLIRHRSTHGCAPALEAHQ